METRRERVVLDILEQLKGQFGHEALESIPPPEDPGSPPDVSERLSVAPRCVTEPSGDEDEALGAGWEGLLPRWKPGSILRFTAWRLRYETQDDAWHAAIHLMFAANQWNAADIGVTFQYVQLAKEADFVIFLGKYKGCDVYAEAFHPNGVKALNRMRVYSPSFDGNNKNQMWKVFLHELGHVLGLRHEDCRWERDGTSVQVGEANPKSVMRSYESTDLPTLQPSDIESARLFYSYENGHVIENRPIRDYDPPTSWRLTWS